MRKVVLIGWREFKQQVQSRSFLFTTIGLPILMIGIWALSASMGGESRSESVLEKLARVERPDLPLGYVDSAGFIQSLPPGVPRDLFIVFPDQTAAATALREERIGAYYIVPPDYLQTSELRRISARLPLAAGDRRFMELVLAWNLTPERSAEDKLRIITPFGRNGLEFVPLVVTPDIETDTEKSPGFAPFFIAMVIMTPLFMAGGFLLQGLAQEKESRVIEIILVSLRPWQLLAGKLLGLGALTIVQFSIWLVVANTMAKVVGQSQVDLLNTVDLSGSKPVLLAAFAFGGFLLYATLMAGLGAVAPNVESTRMWSFLVSSPTILPIFLATTITASPNGLLAVTLSIVPFSAPVGMLMRLMSTSVQGWEVALSLTLLYVTSIGMLLLISRLFRASTLLSGQPISVGRLWQAVRSSSV